jgi:hypothetical protein
MDLLLCDQIQPGSQPDYQICKSIYTDHPLGGKMADGPVSIAQSQAREIAVQEAPSEVVEAFIREWEEMNADPIIHNYVSLSRVYGISSLVAIVDGQDPSTPLDVNKLADHDIWFNVLDPLNTSGSLVLNQIPTAKDFMKPVRVSVSGETYHPSRTQVMMNEAPIYINYVSSGFGFVGRSVYQRALFPLKSFVRCMILNDMIATKGGTIIAKTKQPGALVTKAMQVVAGIKRNFVKQAQTGNVINIDVEEEIASIDLNNVDKAGTFARNNIVRDCETAADMPAKMLDQETMVSGFGEGTEDARRCAQYVDRIRMKMRPVYRFMDNICQYRAWSKPFHERMRAKYGEGVPASYEDAFSQWRENFSATWPSLLIEPESKQVEVERIKLEGIMSLLTALLSELDPLNKAEMIQTAMDNISVNKRMFAHEFAIDGEALLTFLEEKQAQLAESHETVMANPPAKPVEGAKPKGLPKLGAVK